MNPEVKILVIDDEEGIRDWLSYELERQGYLVFTAENGKIGIEKVKKERFNIAIVDMRMPEMDGVTVLEEIKRIDSDIEVIISTGYATMETAIESMRKGANDYITKPYNVDEITIVIEKAIEKQRLKETIALYEISKAILSTVEYDRLLKISINLTMKVLKSDDASLMLFNEEKKLYLAAASYDITVETDKKEKLDAGERIAGWVVKERKPLLLIGELNNDPRFKDIKGRKEIKSSMVIPLIGKDEVMGALNINRIKDEEPFTENDLRKAGIFASQIAIAVENANLIDEQIKKDRLIVQQSRQALMGDLMLYITHQLKQPINAIGLIFQNLKDYNDMGMLSPEYVVKAHDRGMNLVYRMTSIIDDFRDFNKPNREKKTFLFKEALDQAMSIMEMLFSKINVKIDLIIEKNIELTGIPNELAQVMVNMLNNSRNAFIERKIENPVITIKVFEETGKSVISVMDNAGGIDENIIDSIFQPHFSTKEYGSGIGLYMSRMIIEKNFNGTLKAKNFDGGAEFRIEI